MFLTTKLFTASLLCIQVIALVKRPYGWPRQLKYGKGKGQLVSYLWEGGYESGNEVCQDYHQEWYNWWKVMRLTFDNRWMQQIAKFQAILPPPKEYPPGMVPVQAIFARYGLGADVRQTPHKSHDKRDCTVGCEDLRDTIELWINWRAEDGTSLQVRAKQPFRIRCPLGTEAVIVNLKDLREKPDLDREAALFKIIREHDPEFKGEETFASFMSFERIIGAPVQDCQCKKVTKAPVQPQEPASKKSKVRHEADDKFDINAGLAKPGDFQLFASLSLPDLDA